MKRKKGRKISLKGLKLKLWDIFSVYIRRKYADENGMVKCITCPEVMRWQDSQAGHCVPKSLGLSIYFEEKNVRPQCSSCNCAWQGRQHDFIEALKEDYGPNIKEELYAQQKNIRQIKRWEYEELIETYKKKLKSLDGVTFGTR